MQRFVLNKSSFIGLWTLVILNFISIDHSLANDPVDPLLQQADAHFKDEYFYQASFFYQKALDMIPHHSYAHFQIAECYRKLFHYESAKPHYQEVYRSEKEKYPLTGYYLALMYKLTGDYLRSIQYFDDFLAYAQRLRFDKKSSFIQLAQQEKDGSVYALENTMKPKGRFSFSPLPFPVNTNYNDYAPVIYYHDSCLLITSTRTPIKNGNLDYQYGEYYSDHYQFCKAENSAWEDEGKANKLSNLNTKFSEGSGYFIEKEHTFYFTGCYQEGYCHIFQSELKKGEWESPVPLDMKINLPGYESKQPVLTPGGDTLFFVSNRPGGLGGQDLWMSVRSNSATWQEPVNLGTAINTIQNEVSPFYYHDESLLFFSSNGHKGFGGFDIFMTNFTNDSSTLTVINLGPPFNSYKDDLYLSLGKQKGYLSSNREKASGDFDIYSFEITSPDAVLLSVRNTGAESLSLKEYFDVLRFYSAQDQQTFEELPLEEKIKIKRYIEMQAFREIVAEKAVFDENLIMYYEQLPLKEKEFVDRMVTARKNILLRDNENILLTEDEYLYQQLDLEKKEKVERIVETRYYQKMLQESTQTFDSLQAYFESLPLEEREQIQRTLTESKKFIAKNFQDRVSLDDLFFYHVLPSEEKNSIERTLPSLFFAQKTHQGEGNEEIYHFDYERIPLEGQVQFHRIIKARQFAMLAIQDKSKFSGMAEANGLEIGMLSIGNPNNISIEGKVSYKGNPANAVKVGLASDDGKNEKLSVTNSDGNFKFFNVDYRQQQKIFFGEEDMKFMQLAQYTLDELKITVLQDTIIKQTFDNIYFETNQYNIPDGAFSILDSLLNFHFKYRDVQIEISAYADTVGSESYNLQLSQKRAEGTYNYLIEKGVDPTALHIFGKGKEFPHDGKDLEFSRRVEFELQGVATSYNPTREVYVVQAQPDLNEIAIKYGLSLQDLKILNQNIIGTPRPFTPVRILANE